MTPHYRELGTGVRFGNFRTPNDDGNITVILFDHGR